MQGYTISAARPATASVGQFWTIHMRKESPSGSNSGTGFGWRSLPYLVLAKGPHNKQLCEGCKAGHCTESGDDWLMQLQRSANSSQASVRSSLIIVQIDNIKGQISQHRILL
jgi:hypothetical protein